MARRLLPGADDDTPNTVKALHGRLSVLSARLETAETTLAGHAADLTAIGRALAALPADTSGPGIGQDTDDPEEDTEGGRRDWLTVEDPEQAAQWLDEAARWLREVGAHHRLDLPPCWPLHPEVVAEVLALVEVRATAYASTPEAVAEYLGRWLPGARERITEALSKCHGEHLIGATPYAVSGLPVTEVAQWWASDRATSPAIPLRAWMRALDPR